MRVSLQTAGQFHQPQPLFPGFLFCSSVPPAPEVLPLQPLLELPAPAFSPLQAPQPEQLLRAKVDPAIRPAIQKPARIFFRSVVSIIASFEVKGVIFVSPRGGSLKSEPDKMWGGYRKKKWIRFYG